MASASLTAADFDFDLPPGLVAQVPADPRDSARLMVVDRRDGTVAHALVRDLPGILPGRTRLFRNTVAVLRARLRGRLPGGGAAECLLLRPAAGPGCWNVLLRPGRKLGVGRVLALDGGATATVLAKEPDGVCTVRLATPGGEAVADYAERHGTIPLPHYLGREAEDPDLEARRYNTTYADPTQRAAAAAPTAGLHYTPGLLAGLEARGCSFHDLVLRVGLGTFKPLPDDQPLEQVRLHKESVTIPAATLAAMRDRSPGAGPRLAVGTTTIRALEHALRAAPPDFHGPWESEADLFLSPPTVIGCADHLQTNFHLPRSSLLCLVSAFLAPGSRDGIRWLKELYGEAISRGYRFFSYGDSMLIL